MSKIFQRYYCPARTTKGAESTGIGLYLVKQFVEKFGGSVLAYSDGQNGSKFEVKLPIAKAPQRDNEKSADVHSSATILIVDDNRQIAEFLENELSNNYTCYVAHNGKAGLDLALKYLPDIIVADIMMPVMDGIEMTRHIRANKQTAEIPIIMLTAKDDSSTEKISLSLNANAFVAKPFDVEQLILRIEQLLSSRKAIEEKAHIDSILKSSMPMETSEDERFVKSLQENIEKNLSDADFNVNALAVKMKMSPKQLYRRMKALTGRTPIEYLNEVRMKKAAMLLAQGSFCVSEVMYLVGYTNSSYFAKCFSAVYGMSPKQYASAKAE
ncbi:MAG: response regulator [Bacteroidales bacterium]|nr:response regulator [Bacteroidales bacterium]